MVAGDERDGSADFLRRENRVLRLEYHLFRAAIASDLLELCCRTEPVVPASDVRRVVSWHMSRHPVESLCLGPGRLAGYLDGVWGP